MIRKSINEVFDVEISGDTHTVDVAELIDYLKVDPVSLDEDLREQPGRFAWVAVLTAQADYDAGKVKQRLAAVKAAIGSELHAANDGKGRNERMTEASIEETVTLDDDVIDTTTDYQEAARRAAILVAMREAYRQRHTMLQALARGIGQQRQAEE